MSLETAGRRTHSTPPPLSDPSGNGTILRFQRLKRALKRLAFWMSMGVGVMSACVVFIYLGTAALIFGLASLDHVVTPPAGAPEAPPTHFSLAQKAIQPEPVLAQLELGMVWLKLATNTLSNEEKVRYGSDRQAEIRRLEKLADISR